MIWVWAHIYYLIEFDNKLIVMLQWGWNYFTRGRGARIITGEGQIQASSVTEVPEQKVKEKEKSLVAS
jgi:NADH dehydrogenase